MFIPRSVHFKTSCNYGMWPKWIFASEFSWNIIKKWLNLSQFKIDPNLVIVGSVRKFVPIELIDPL